MNALRIASFALAMTVAGSAMAQTGRAASKREDSEKEKLEQQRAALRRNEKQFPLGASWTVVSLNGKPFGGSERPSFSLDQQFRVKGYGGCNTFSATAYPLKEQAFAVGPLALTKRSCDKAVMANEMQFLTALRTSAKWDTDGNTLTVKTQRGELRFERAF